MTAKFLTSAFADCITLVNATKGMKPKEIARVLKQYGVEKDFLQDIFELIEKYLG